MVVKQANYILLKKEDLLKCILLIPTLQTWQRASLAELASVFKTMKGLYALKQQCWKES